MIFFNKGLKFVRQVFWTKKGRVFKEKGRQQKRIHDIEQIIQQEKDKMLQRCPW